MPVTQKSLKLKDLENMTPESIQEWTSVFKDRGFNFKKIPSRKSSPKKKLSNEEKSEQDFDPNLCHARAFQPKKHPGTNIPMYKVPGHALVCGIIPMQCQRPHTHGNLCSGHADTGKFADHFRCFKQGLFLGLCTETCPDKPIRHHKGNGLDGKVKEFIWFENTDETYDKYKTDPDSTKSKSKSPPKSKSPKSKSPKGEKPKVKKETPTANYNDFNWEELISTNDINSLKKFQLNTYIQEHNLEIKGHCKTLVAGIIDHFINFPVKEESEEEEEKEESEEEKDSGEDSEEKDSGEDSEEKEEDSGEDSAGEYDECSGEKSEEKDSGEDSESDTESESESDSGEDEDDEDDEKMNQEDVKKETKIIEDVEYYIEENNFFDIKTKIKMGRIDPDTKKGFVWIKKSKLIHLANIENCQKSIK